MTNALVTIVVPAYNVEEYIGECLDSILGQTYHNLEVLVINDGSRDKSGEIADDYAKKDDRIRVIHKKNEGQPKAKNRGISEAKGEFITFVDSDDYLRNDFVANLVRDMINSGVQVVTTNKTCPINEDRAERLQVYSQKKAFEKMFYGTLEESENGVQLYTRSLLSKHNIIANTDRKIGEDFDFLAQALMHCDRIAVDNRRMYYYRPNPKSLMRQAVNAEIMKSISTYAAIGKKVTEMYPDIRKAVDAKKFNDSVALAIRSYDTRYQWTDELRKIFENIHNLRWQTLFDNKTRGRVRTAALIYCVCGNSLGTRIIRRIKR